MTKKQRKSIAKLAAGLFLMVALYCYCLVFKSNNIYILVGIIITTVLIEGILLILLPIAKSRISKEKDKKQKQKVKNDNILRSDNIILKLPLYELSWREFERLCFLYYKARGYKPRETSEGSDGGVDLIIFNRQHQTDEAIQIKHYFHSGNKITVKDIRELNSSKRNRDCILATFITSSTYTKEALKQADDFKIKCKDIHWVENHIVKWKQQEARRKIT